MEAGGLSDEELLRRLGGLYTEVVVAGVAVELVEARKMAAYIDLNPVRAGMVKDPADYRWSSYGEAVGGAKKGNGKKAREGLVRAYLCDQGVGVETEKWQVEIKEDVTGSVEDVQFRHPGAFHHHVERPEIAIVEAHQVRGTRIGCRP